MAVYARNVKCLDDAKIEVTFNDGKIIEYDMHNLLNKYPELNELVNNELLFKMGHVDIGGYGIIWTDEFDVDAMTVYEDGTIVGMVPISLTQKIGVLLAKTREELNITQIELSKMSHIDQGDISKIEKGFGNPTLGKIYKLFEAMGKSIDFTLIDNN